MAVDPDIPRHALRSGTTTGTPAVVLKHLGRTFGEHGVLQDLGLEIAAGEFVALLGRSGSGKSTLLRVLAALDGDVSGEVLVPRQRAIVFQDARLFPWQRVLRNVLMGLPRTARNRALALSALEEVGLSHRLGAWPRTLSGGEAQRVALARALVREPQLLLLDEPFGALDALTRLRMHGLLRDLYARHRPAVLLVTHDVDEAIQLAGRILVLREGRIAVDMPVDLPPQQRHAAPGFGPLRAHLLRELGVEPD
ncbi:sulfonate ABC transporter ATP-binding protein [Bordetella genomosp. 10]|uniref:Sulfonate ABC transporter ATP-binding protein n=1 Tax=Bordetella genomosp. 10 TaxID=1416804 RepID=A0A261SNE4_9BORD|nr:ABC transporter ATP-binding protein [Bordetella genomosp. 10]OZI37843.1 sulfonate ABC transporter ATP-binding protein [Bordetella genomosp. 10]